MLVEFESFVSNTFKLPNKVNLVFYDFHEWSNGQPACQVEGVGNKKAVFIFKESYQNGAGEDIGRIRVMKCFSTKTMVAHNEIFTKNSKSENARKKYDKIFNSQNPKILETEAQKIMRAVRTGKGPDVIEAGNNRKSVVTTNGMIIRFKK